MLPGISMITPSETLISGGVPQPTLAIGPMTKRPCSGGKKDLRSEMIRGAFATTSWGNITDSIAPVRTPSMIASRRMPRLSPRIPPTPRRVKPKPSWSPPGNSAVITTSREKPVDPSGILVVIRPIALSDRNSANSSSSAPAYSPA